MSGEFSPELRKELLDDFYAECDELLAAIRQSLAEMQDSAGNEVLNTEGIESLFRSIHSLKGIAAIADVRPAEQLAHETEGLLRALSTGEVPLSAERFELLLDAIQCLEKIINAHRQGAALPDPRQLQERLRAAALSEEQEAAGRPPPFQPAADAIAGARRKGMVVWRCLFAPSPSLDERGVNVDAMRGRLGALGQILSITPSVRPDGSIIFAFIVAMPDAPAAEQLLAWEEDGLRCEPLTTGEAAPAPKNASTTLTPSHLVRVDLARLDELMRITGELVIQRSRLEARLAREFGEHEGLKDLDSGFARLLRDLRKAVARVRMVPVAEIFTRVPFVVRDLTSASAKKVNVVLEGRQTEIDKYLVERLNEPLLHLVRNAVSHGLENPAERVAAGKSPEGTLLLRATSVGESAVIQVRDDGRGIDAEAVAARARSKGMTVPAELDAMALLGILAAPGFSTKDQVDRAAGRGVGMNVVVNTIRELGGTVTLESHRGEGTEFTLRLPLTLSISDALIVEVGTESFAVPQSSIEEIIQSPARESRTIKQSEVIPYRAGLLPLVRLATRFGLDAPPRPVLTVLVMSSERGAVGLVVDRVRSRREIVVRPLSDSLVRVPGFSGATELGDGRPLLILDGNALTRGVVRPPNHLLRSESSDPSS